MEGLVLYGMNNIFTVVSSRRRFLCRIKGKVLKNTDAAYNPLAPGDVVRFVSSGAGQGLITERMPRRNAFSRWNRKREATQTVAANLDLVICVLSLGTPPFRPRFADRVLIAAAGIPVLLIVNKNDLPAEGWEEERIEGYARIGYPVIRCSARTGEGIDELGKRIHGMRALFIGQSGVGKSSLLNRLVPGAELETGEVSSKYDRGRHTTKNGQLVPYGRSELIDSPGIRQLELSGIEARRLAEYFEEFIPYLGSCAYQSCSHREEPNCRIREAVESGAIQADRYESYLRIYEEVKGRESYG